MLPVPPGTDPADTRLVAEGVVLAGRTRGVHLDERGLEQARRAAERLAEVRLATVVSSPLERCREHDTRRYR